MTAERFLPDPWSDVPGARMYATGDVARVGYDGCIDFLGRSDFQVKVRGFRIELGEIESLLESCEDVAAAVVVKQDDGAGFGVLVAYVTLSTSPPDDDRGGDDLDETLREVCFRKLPQYMVPSRFVALAEFPLTTSGKVDRKALLALEHSVERSDSDFVAPHGDLEIRLAGLWKELLGVERVGRDDDFFRLGGHSLTATRMVARLQDEKIGSVTLVDVFRHPRLAEFAAFCRGLDGVSGEPKESKKATPAAPDIAPMTEEELQMLMD